MTAAQSAVYWDASAAVSLLIDDEHTADAVVHLRSSRAHLMSTLAYAEVLSVLGRFGRGRIITQARLEKAHAALASGPWHLVTVSPTWAGTYRLAERWPLRGADLWHLAAAESLRNDFPEVQLLTYDRNLHEAATGEGLVKGR